VSGGQKGTRPEGRDSLAPRLVPEAPVIKTGDRTPGTISTAHSRVPQPAPGRAEEVPRSGTGLPGDDRRRDSTPMNGRGVVSFPVEHSVVALLR